MTNILRIANNKDLCCGCNACSVMCPEKAIIMVADKCGHRYPEIDKTKCKDCSYNEQCKDCALPYMDETIGNELECRKLHGLETENHMG